jgi:ADP-ribosylglycohydrolase
MIMRSDRDDRVAGVLLGQAVGDAIGAPYEFRTPPAYGQARFGRGTFGHPAGSYTDDGEQMVCIAAARSDVLKAAENLLAWFADPGVKDIGTQTRSVMSRAKTPRGLAQASRAYARRQELRPRPRGWDPGSGNGSLMRTSAVCLPMIGDRKRIAVTARKISSLTHADDWACDACVLWSLAVSDAVELGEAFTPAAALRDGLQFIGVQRREFWRRLIEKALTGPQPGSRNGSAVSAFGCALWAVAHADSLPDGLYLAVSIGGDTDTVAAIAGGLLGSIHGASAVPARWRRKVHGWPGYRAADLERLALAAAGVPERPAA